MGVTAAPQAPPGGFRSAALRLRRRGRGSLGAFVPQRGVSFVSLSIAITFVAFLLTHLVPADPAVAALGDRASSDEALVQAFRECYGLDKPLPVQYGIYLWRLVDGALGMSIQT